MHPLSQPDAWERVATRYAETSGPTLAAYGRDALDWAAPAADDEVLEVACGPGELLVAGAPRVRRYTGIDFSPRMVRLARARAEKRGLDNVRVEVGDGQELPFDDASFDLAFCMFALFFFPDRARGLAELHRALRPGGTVLLSAWSPPDRSPLVQLVVEAMQVAGIEGKKERSPFAALSNPAQFIAELEAAGFEGVEVRRIVHTRRVEDVHSFWRSRVEGSASLAQMRAGISNHEWPAVEARILDALSQALPDLPTELGAEALVARATKPR
jgi:ubiquinone/menaquinone biosynthesis C-methylase UbiE